MSSPGLVDALLAAMTLLWSMNYIAGKVALHDFPAPLLAGLRTALAALCLIPVYMVLRRGARPRSRADFASLTLLGLLGVAANQFFYVAGLGRTSVAHASFMIALTPVLVLLIAAALGQERLGRWKLAGMGIAATGVVALQSEPSHRSGATLAGDALVFSGALSFAFYTVLGKRVSGRFGSVTVNSFAFWTGSLALLPLTLAGGSGFAFRRVTPLAWWALVYMAVFASVAAYLIYSYALAYVPASRAAVFSYLQPFLATLLAIPLLHEPLTLPVVGGGALVLAGVALSGKS